MARSFLTSSNQYLSVSSAVVSATPLTMACWFFKDTDTSGADTLMAISDDTANKCYWRLVLVNGDVWANNSNDSGTQAQATVSSFSADTWEHGVAVFASATSRTAYINGSAGTENTTNITDGTTLSGTQIGAAKRLGILHPLDGDVAEAAIWNVALTSAEISVLAAGFSPLFIRPASLVAYWPLIRGDQDRVGGYDMSPISSPTVGTHPPKIIYPTTPIYTPAPVAAPAGSEGPLVSGRLIRGGSLVRGGVLVR